MVKVKEFIRGAIYVAVVGAATAGIIYSNKNTGPNPPITFYEKKVDSDETLDFVVGMKSGRLETILRKKSGEIRLKDQEKKEFKELEDKYRSRIRSIRDRYGSLRENLN